MKLIKIIYDIITYLIISFFCIFITIAIIATIMGDGNKGFFELFI